LARKPAEMPTGETEMKPSTTRAFAVTFFIFSLVWPAMFNLAYGQVAVSTPKPSPTGTTAESPKTKLPSGFVAISDTPLTWDDAKKFCQKKGGRLPLIAGRDTLAASGSLSLPDTTPIDGFGTSLAPWPSDLPIKKNKDGSPEQFWTGTQRTGDPDVSFSIGRWDGGRNGRVAINYGHQFNTYSVLCVPK
jgi:hypothetical protein